MTAVKNEWEMKRGQTRADGRKVIRSKRGHVVQPIVDDNSKRPVSDREYRQILDEYLRGLSFREIARIHRRSVEAIKLIIRSKIPGNYDESDSGVAKRRPVYLRILACQSMLDPNRVLNKRNVDYFARMHHKFDRTLEECRQVMVLSKQRIAEVRQKFGLGEYKKEMFDL